MNAFQRLDHLLCDVPDIDAAFELFHQRLGFPVAWPIGRYWPTGRTCGLALGGINLELIQPDVKPPTNARIRGIAFEPTDRAQEVLEQEGIPFKVVEKWETSPELLKLRGMPIHSGAQLLCTNLMPGDYAIEFPFFACNYSVTVKKRLRPEALPLEDKNSVVGVLLGHPSPGRLGEQLQRLGIQEGVRLSVAQHGEKEVVAITMRNGPIDLGGWPARFSFVGT